MRKKKDYLSERELLYFVKFRSWLSIAHQDGHDASTVYAALKSRGNAREVVNGVNDYVKPKHPIECYKYLKDKDLISLQVVNEEITVTTKYF